MLIGLKETMDLIRSGKPLHIAADERLLSQLPKGNWIGGTTPYFITESGGLLTEDKLFVDEISVAETVKFSVYDDKTFKTVAADAFDNGFTLFVLPFGSPILEAFAKDAAEIDGIFLKNIAGWVSGFNLGTGGTARTFNGKDGKSYADKAVAMHVALPKGKLATVNIVNIFEADQKSPAIEFPANAFVADKCRIGGKDVRFADYITENNIDTKLPLVANYGGSNVNISIQQIDGKNVKLYAPVFKGMQYHFALPVADYEGEFAAQIKKCVGAKPVFSCNCILNYLYGALEGKRTAPFFGPVTFGEVAYQLVNQTLVYVSVE
jgi:hypothetical protein